MKSIWIGCFLGVIIILLLEGSQIYTSGLETSVFQMNYFVKNAFLALILAALSTYTLGSLRKPDAFVTSFSTLVFACAFASTIASFKFLLVGFAFQIIRDTYLYSRTQEISPKYLAVSMMGLVLFGYSLYLEFFNVQDQIFII